MTNQAKPICIRTVLLDLRQFQHFILVDHFTPLVRTILPQRHFPPGGCVFRLILL